MKWLQSCTVAQLQSIARSIGSNTGGKKDVLRSHVLDELQHDRFTLPSGNGRSGPSQHKIVSIDMGIRNLAICSITVSERRHPNQPLAVPVVQNWERIAISKKANADIPEEGTDGSIAKEAFDPQTYAQYAYDLVVKRIMTYQPTQILIERQRFRSMGGSAVQEWTLRVNMFEAMIYATLRTLSEIKLWQGLVYPVAPAKVSKFWLEDDNDEHAKLATSKSLKTKSAKIALVGDWLYKGQLFELQGEAAVTARAYQMKLARRRERKGAAKQMATAEQSQVPHDIGKLDDLADCLMQAIAWIQWEKNRRALRSGEPKVMGSVHFASENRSRSRKSK
ncbi:MAG: hypothetical protein HETSPECPRED_008253 [Heterodermia speciosa]|uniref:Mitochondrial resolvase Ydc2 catalytic domain-containing protein n=1 Tax=Heterodermia speciosa TaxID=116794 RepID=A0A8H3FTL8_9LECA|nr:MAG: hypothetical protein HETSPECPRED_008253 [Heterodermia speciosa]